MPREHTLEPCPKLPDGPVHPLPQGLFDLLQLLAEPLGDRLAPDRKLARPRLTAYVRQAEKVEGLRFPLATPLAPFMCPTPKLNEACLVRVQFEVKPVEACPQVAQKLLGIVFVLEADNEIVTVPHDTDIAPCVLATPLRSPEVKDIVEIEIRKQRACTAPLGRPFLLLSPVPILQHARLEPLAHVTDNALVPNPVLDKLHQPFVVNRIVRSCMLMPPSRTRKTCLRSNSPTRLAGENVQHIDMLCMSPSICLYVLDILSYIIAQYMSTVN